MEFKKIYIQMFLSFRNLYLYSLSGLCYKNSTFARQADLCDFEASMGLKNEFLDNHRSTERNFVSKNRKQNQKNL